MNYATSSVCKSHRYCSVCRRQNAQGLAYRRSIAKTANEPTDDFACPVNLPWLPLEPTIEQLQSFSRLVDDRMIQQYASTDPAIKVAFSKEMLNQMFKHRVKFLEQLPENHVVAFMLKKLDEAQADPKGCTSCKMNTYIRGLSQAIDKCSSETKQSLIDLLTEFEGGI
jgi:hypothetical protein